MRPRFLAVLSILIMILLVVFTMVLNARNRRASTSSEEITVISRTRGDEVLTAETVNNQVRVRLKNNRKETITAFAIGFADMTIREDFAYSEVNFGIEPGDTFQKDYPVSPLPTGSELPTLYLLTVLLKDGTKDGDSKVAQQIQDERLGEKAQILRTLRVFEKKGHLRKDLEMVKSDIMAALDTGESETRIILNELQPALRNDDKLSDDLRNGLQWGREKMLRRFEVLEQQPAESWERAFLELKERTHKVFQKL